MTIKKPSPFSKKIEPRKISSDKDPVTMGYLDTAPEYPRVIQPALPKLDPIGWAESNRDLTMTQLAQHGAVLFRGFNLPTRKEFEHFARALCPNLYSDYGDLPKVGKIYEVTPYPPDKIIGFHNESSHMHRWPMRQFFYCEQPALGGGTTPVVDCRKVLAALDPEIREALASKGLRYTRNFIKGVDVPWSDFFGTEDRAEVATYCKENNISFAWKGAEDLMTWQECPGIVSHPTTGELLLFAQVQLHHIAFLDSEVRESLIRQYGLENLPRNVYFGDGSEIPFEWAHAIDTHYWKLSVEFAWQQGDVLLVDNMLVAHARQTFTPPRRMFVAMGEIMHEHELANASKR